MGMERNAVWRSDEFEGVYGGFPGGTSRWFIGGCEVASGWSDPDLEQVDLVGLGGVELRIA